MGERAISLRGDGPWRGKATRAVVDRGDRRFTRLINGYVSSDGHEIRMMPGWKTIWDGTEENNFDNGYLRLVDDFKLPVYASPLSSPNRGPGNLTPWVAGLGYDTADTGEDYRDLLTLKVRSRPTHLHGFAQMNGRLIVYGESGHRFAPVFKASPGGVVSPSTPGNRIDIEYVHSLGATSPSNKWRIFVSQPNAGIIGLAANRDWATAGTPQTGWQYIRVNDIVWIDGITVSDSTHQGYVDATLNNRFHRIEALGASGGHEFYDLTTESTSPINTATTPATTPLLGTTKPNRTGVYSPDGITPYEVDRYSKIDEEDALTVWWLTDPLSTDDVSTACHPSYVANRQRDYGDSRAQFQVEGVNLRGLADTRAGISRRRQKALDFRLNPEKAGKRLILAAPGYACLFQVPMIVPVTGVGWPATDSSWSPGGGAGVLYPLNDAFDKPRCLGVPKAMWIQSQYANITPTSPENPQQIPHSTDYVWFPSHNTPSNTWTTPAGGRRYRIAISYEDEATGEEGLASEPVTVNLPGDQFTHPTTGSPAIYNATFQVPYVHPGYLFPECLALKINIYIGEGSTGPMGYYTSLPMADKYLFDEGDRSAKYGFDPATPGGGGADTRMWRFLVVPLPYQTSSVTDAIDTTRLAPSANNMPRGAECARYIRGILLSVGHSGTHGDGALRRTFLSSVFNPNISPIFWDQEDQVANRALRSPREFTSTPTDSEAEDGGFGLASNYFPSAYQGTDIWSLDVYPEPRKLNTVDRIVNMASHQVTTPAFGGTPGNLFELEPTLSMSQRLRMVEAPWDEDLADPLTPATRSQGHVEAYHVLPRGQVQIGEPGRPDVALTSQIQFLDPSKEDDGIAIGQFQGAAILCSKHETHALNWRVAPAGETPRLISREHGCIATNSMVEFDGGLAWISDRGPVAMTGQGLQFVGADIEEDFYGSNRRYLKDSRGLMRHCWGAHDKSRGLILWGMVTSDATHTIDYRGQTVTFSQASDKGKSRFPGNEVLVWSYRANAWSVWQMPSGLEVLWADEITDTNGDQRMAFLAADQRIYVWDDRYQDTNTRPLTHIPSTAGSGTTMNTSSFTFGVDGVIVAGIATGLTARGSNNTFLRVGMTIVQTDGNGNFKDQTTVSALSFATQTVTFAKSMTWAAFDVFSFGHRPEMEIQTAYVGETLTSMDVEALHVRYWMPWEGNSNAFSWVRADVHKSDELDIVGSPRSAGFTQDPEYELLGAPANGQKTARRKTLTQGRAVGAEASVSIKVLGQCQVRISDLLLEVS